MVRWFTILGFYEALEVVLFLVFISVKVVYSLKIQITFLNKEGRHPVLLAGDALRLCFHLVSTGSTIVQL